MSNMGGHDGDGGPPEWKPHLGLQSHELTGKDTIADYPVESIMREFYSLVATITPNVFVTEDDLIREPLAKPNGCNANLWEALTGCYAEIIKQPPFCNSRGPVLHMVMQIAARGELHQLHETYMSKQQEEELAQMYSDEFRKPGGKIYESLREIHHSIAPMYDPLSISDAVDIRSFSRGEIVSSKIDPFAKGAGRDAKGEATERLMRIQFELCERTEWFLNNLAMPVVEKPFYPTPEPELADVLRGIAKDIGEYMATQEGQGLCLIHALNILYEASREVISIGMDLDEQRQEMGYTPEQFRKIVQSEAAELYSDWCFGDPSNRMSYEIIAEERRSLAEDEAIWKAKKIGTEPVTTLHDTQPRSMAFYHPLFGRERDGSSDLTLIEEYTASAAVALAENPITYMNKKGETVLTTIENADGGEILCETFMKSMTDFFTDPRSPVKGFSPNTYQLIATLMRMDTERVIDSIVQDQGYLKAEDIEGMADVIFEKSWIRSITKRQYILEHAHAYEALFGAIPLIGNTDIHHNISALPTLPEIRIRMNRFLDWVQSGNTKPYSDDKERISFRPLAPEYAVAFKEMLEETLLSTAPDISEDQYRLDIHKVSDDESFCEYDMSHLRMDVSGTCQFLLALQPYAVSVAEHVDSPEAFKQQMKDDLPTLFTNTLKHLEQTKQDERPSEADIDTNVIQVAHLFLDGRASDVKRSDRPQKTPTQLIHSVPSIDGEKARTARLKEVETAQQAGATLH